MIQPDNMRNPNTGRRTMTVSAYNQANPDTQWGANTKAVIHGSSGKTYTLDQQTYDWVKSRNQQYWADSYGLDDADQLAKKNGQMSAAARKSYTNSKLDQQLFELGLPSEKNLEKVLAQYNQWHTGGMDQVFGKMNLPKDYWTKTKGWYQSDMQNAYENTAEDQQRKMRGLMPSKWESKYTDTEIDDQLRARGLPPLSEFKTYANRYDSYQGINALYANVAGKQTNLRLQGIKDDDTEYDGVKGKDLYTAAFYDELERKNDDGSFVYGNIMDKFKNSAKPSSGTPTGDYAYDRGAAILTGNKDMASEADYDSYNAFSYDDYKKRYPEYYDRYYANAQTNSGQLVSDALAVQAREADEEATKEYYTIGKEPKAAETFAHQYEADYPDATPEQMFLDMNKNNVPDTEAHKVYETMKKEAAGTSKWYDIVNGWTKTYGAVWSTVNNSDAPIPDVAKPMTDEQRDAQAEADRVKAAQKYSRALISGDQDALYAASERVKILGYNNFEALSESLKEDKSPQFVQAVKDAITVYESAMAAYEETAGYGAPSEASREPINKANEALNALGFKSVHDAIRYVGGEKEVMSPGKYVAQKSDEMNAAVKAGKEKHANDTETIDATREAIESQLFGEAGTPLTAKEVREVVMEYDNAVNSDDRAALYDATQKLRAIGLVNREAADEWLRTHSDHDATEAVNPNNLDVDGVIQILEAVKKDSNPVAMELALKDLGFNDGDFSGAADDLTYGWSDEDKRKLSFYLGGGKLSDRTYDEIIPGFNRAEGDTIGDTWADAGVAQDRRQLKTEDFSLALEWVLQQVNEGKMTEADGYNLLAANGYQNEMEAYMPDEWHKAHFVENTAPGLWAQSEESEKLLWEEMTPEQQRAASEAMWEGLTDEQKASMYRENWWEYDPSVYRTFNQTLEQQFRAVLPGLAAELIGTPVKVADAIGAALSGRPDMWDTTKNIMALQQGISQLGAVTDNVNGAKVAQVASDVAQEILKMEVYGTIGGIAKGAFTSTKVGSALASVATANGGSKVVKKAADMFLGMVGSSPFVVSAFANNYTDAKALGADNSEATWYGMITGLTEGILEGFEFDELWGRTINGDKFAQQLLAGAKGFQRMGIVGKARVASMVVSGLGEFTEESIGYVVETALKMRHGDTWGKGTEWSTQDWLDQAMMGFLTGALGGGLHSIGSITADSLIKDYAMHDEATFRQVFPDLVEAVGRTENLPEATRRMYEKGGATVLSADALQEVNDQIKRCDDGIANAPLVIKGIEDKAQKKIDSAYEEVRKYDAKLAPYASMDTLSGEDALIFSDLIDKRAAAQRRFEAESKAIRSEADEQIEKANNALNGARDQKAILEKKVQEHWAGVYFSNKAAIIDGLTDEIVTNLAQSYKSGMEYTPADLTGAAAEGAELVRKGANNPVQTKLAEAEAIETIEEAKQTTQEPKNTDAEQAATIRKLTDEEVTKVQQAAKDLKYKGDVVFIDDPSAEDAWIDDNGTITINRANISESEAKELADNPGWWLLKHEFTHFAEGTAEYDAYSAAVQSIMQRRFGDNYGKVLEAIKQDYAQRGRVLDDAGALRELVAKFSQSGEIFNNADTINSFVREQGNVADRIYNWIRYKINDLKLRRKSNSALARELLNAERLYAQAYRAANRKAPKGGSSTSAQFATGRSLQSLTDEYAGVANPRTGVTAEEDAAYMRAALAGDTETAGRMVRDMYERNGLMHVYRGEPKATGSWTQVNMDNFKGPSSGMFAATDIDTARAAEYTHSYAREDLKTKPLSYGDEMPVLQQFADGVAQRIGRGLNLVAESYYMDDEGNTYAEDGKGREHHWALRDADTGDIFADSTELTTLADAAKRKAARLIGGNPQNIYNSIDDPFAGRILDLFVKFDNANEHNARGDEWDKIQLNSPKGVTLYRIEVTYDPENESMTTVTAYPIDESFDAESSSASERETKSITFEADDMDYMYKLEKAFKDMFGPKSDVAEFFMDYADWNEDGATLDKVGVRDKNGRYVSPELFPDAETTSTDELAVRDKAAGYDGSIIRNVRDGGSRTTTDTVSFNPNYIKSADAITYDDEGNIIPLSQRGDFSRNELRYSTGRSLNDLLQQYGAIEPGREPRARDVEVPRQTNDMNRVSQWIRSLIESGKLTDDQAQNVLRMVVEQDYGTYVPTSQAERMEEARAYIAERQPLQAQQEFHDMVMQGKFGVKTNALGIQLLSDASARGDIASVLDIAADLQLAATEAGQSAQIFNVLKELKGVGSAWYMQKVVDRMNSKYADRIAAGKMQRISVDPALMAELAKATTVDQMAAAEEAVAKDVARQLPLTWDDRLSSWRYFSMLANPTTHIRNITGNLLMKGLNTAKDAVATGLENILGVDQSDRAHAILSQADKNTWGNWVQQSYEEQARNLQGGGKLGFETFIKQNMRSFDTKWVNALAQFNFRALENEDIAFIRPAYKNALMQYMVAQGYTLNEKGVAGKTNAKGEFVEMTKAQQNAAIDWASQQAWKQTFRDASSLATMLNKISKETAVSRLLVEGVMPFKKTPINIAKRGIEYSPAGIIMGVAQLTNGVKKGKVTTAQAIDNLASGITGSALMALGVMLAKLGVIRAGGEKDKKLETYLEDTGDQTYAMKFGDKSINMSSIAPATIPLFMGVALNEMIEQGGDSLDLSTITDTIAGTLNPFMEMSFMSSLNSALKNYNANGIGGALGSTLMTAAQNYGSQYLPTLGGKVAQFLDPTRRTTKSDATSPVGGNMDYYWRSLVKKVPGAEATLQPDVDVWGRTDKKDSFREWALDFANKFILPTNIKVTNRDAVDNELIRVVESTGVTDFLPSDGNKYFQVNKQKYTMNAKQYTQYSQERGQAAYAALKDTMAGASYKNASDEEKAAMLKKAIDAAYKVVNNTWKERLGAYK